MLKIPLESRSFMEYNVNMRHRHERSALRMP